MASSRRWLATPEAAPWRDARAFSAADDDPKGTWRVLVQVQSPEFTYHDYSTERISRPRSPGMACFFLSDSPCGLSVSLFRCP